MGLGKVAPAPVSPAPPGPAAAPSPEFGLALWSVGEQPPKRIRNQPRVLWVRSRMRCSLTSRQRLAARLETRQPGLHQRYYRIGQRSVMQLGGHLLRLWRDHPRQEVPDEFGLGRVLVVLF